MFNDVVAKSTARKVSSGSWRNELEIDQLDFWDNDDDSTNGVKPAHMATGKGKEKENDRLWEDKDFWEFVDLVLEQLHEDVKKQPTLELHKKEWDK